MEAKNSGSRSKKAAYTTQYLRVIARELICTKDHFKDGNRGPFDRKQLGGLALSGGGVRSASFAFGVMQALAVVHR